MTDPARTFAVASDEALGKLIRGATRRLVVIAPALTKPVAEALASRFPEIGRLDMTVILDADPEVYRLGFGDPEALDAIRAAAANHLFDLREQPGVRIGVVISDDTTMVYSPVSRNIEAGSTSVEKPNAILLGGAIGDRLAAAAGADNSETAPKPEVGTKALEPERVEEMQADLKVNRPKPFDITRRMNVFSSRVQYVELSVENCRFTTRQIALPPEFFDLTDDDLKKRITSRVRAPFENVGKIDVKFEFNNASETVQVDDKWLKDERKRIEDEYTFPIKKFGRVILYTDRQKFDAEVARFETIIEAYRVALAETLSGRAKEFADRIQKEFASKWVQSPPAHFKRWNLPATAENIERELARLAKEMFEEAISFEPPKVKILYKNVAPENVVEKEFLGELKRIMKKRRVPESIIESLFQSGDAAPGAKDFLRG